MNTPKVSIIIVNYNHKYFPGMCVEAIERSEVNFEYEIIVVDNNSQDQSIDTLRELHRDGRIHLIESGGNLGYGRGNNLGAKHAKGEFVIISNPDIFVKPTTMQRLVDDMEKDEMIGLMGPRLRYYNGEVQESCRRNMNFFDLVIKRTFLKKLPYFKKRLSQYLMHDFDHNNVQEVDLITGAYFIMRRSVYEEVKGFDPMYFLFMEDYDLCRTLDKAGYKIVYNPKAEAEHYHKRLSSGNVLWLFTKKVFWIHLHSSFKYFWKWKGKKSNRMKNQNSREMTPGSSVSHSRKHQPKHRSETHSK
jgi:GT2 family glycosyltransferase